MQKTEKELKFLVTDLEELVKSLLKNGAEVLNRSKEKTIRLDTADMTLEKRGVFIRVRAGSKNTITLKEKIGEDTTVRQRKETEFEIEDVDKMAYILEKIGLNYVRIMEKYRLNLKYKGAVLSIDEMPFGLYLEIEGEEEQINNIAVELGYSLDNKILGTYWDIFEDHKKETGETGTNIVFSENFGSKLMSLPLN